MRSAIAFLVCCVSTLFANPAAARAPAVKDQARLFQPETAQQANQEIKKIDEQFHQKLVIETYPKTPNSFLASWLKKKPDFGEWAKKHAGRSGLYILICTESAPPDIRILARGDMQRAFPSETCEELKNQLQAELTAGKNDQGLLNVLVSVRQQLSANLGPPPAFPWSGVFEVLLAVLGAWLVILVARALVLGAKLASPLPADFGAAGSLPVAWFQAVASGRLRELFASGSSAIPPQTPVKTPRSDSAKETMAPLHSDAGGDFF